MITTLMPTKVWRKVKLGNGPVTADDFQRLFTEKNLRLGVWAGDILLKKDFTVAPKETQIDLVRISVYDLGFKRSTRYDHICLRAKERGFELCPAEVGPQLRLQYLDQPRNEQLFIAMRAIRDLSNNSRGIFSVIHGDNGRWLDTFYGDPEIIWDTSNRFVFRKTLAP